MWLDLDIFSVCCTGQYWICETKEERDYQKEPDEWVIKTNQMSESSISIKSEIRSTEYRTWLNTFLATCAVRIADLLIPTFMDGCDLTSIYSVCAAHDNTESVKLKKRETIKRNQMSESSISIKSEYKYRTWLNTLLTTCAVHSVDLLISTFTDGCDLTSIYLVCAAQDNTEFVKLKKKETIKKNQMSELSKRTRWVSRQLV